jgi:predicted alpha/beta hydrolase family esterase
LTTLADDAAATRRALDRMDGPAVLVGHSLRGAVITEAGDFSRRRRLSTSPPLVAPPATAEQGRSRNVHPALSRISISRST